MISHRGFESIELLIVAITTTASAVLACISTMKNEETEFGMTIVADILLKCESLVLSLSESGLITWLVTMIQKLLTLVGAPETFRPSAVDTSRSVVAITLTLFFYYVFFGNRHSRRRRRLATELRVAKEKLHYLQEQLRDNSAESADEKKEIRIFLDGAFDMMHYGHMNAFRLAKSLGTHLVVAVNSDESITNCKGKPLMNDDERMTMVSACKFVDEVVPDCPYVMNKGYLDHVIEKYNIDYVVHGDDPCFVDGQDVYAVAKAAGKFRTIPRTEGVSTTDIVGRMLLLTKEHHLHGGLGSQSKFLTTSRMLKLFSADVRTPTKDIRVIYIDGAWDLFHPGHVAVLKAAKEVSVL
jgi:ethanolamine-phosphate cytidylyltransferase